MNCKFSKHYFKIDVEILDSHAIKPSNTKAERKGRFLIRIIDLVLTMLLCSPARITKVLRLAVITK